MAAATDTPQDADVAIVGAGPIGLFLAGDLAAGGVRTVVLESADAPSTIPKANGIVGHSALVLAERGILAGTGLRVVSPPRFQFGPLPLDLGSGPRNPLHILAIPQRRLEGLLEARAARDGAEIRRGHEVRDFTAEDDAVHVDVHTAHGTATVRAGYLVGCDGAHSLVRTSAGIGFPGFTSDEIARIARITIPEDAITAVGDGFDIPGVGHVAAMRPNRLSGGGFSIGPARVLDADAPPDLYLVSTLEPRGDARPGDPVSVDDLRASLLRVLGAPLRFSDATAIRSTVGSSRQAEVYRRGRVFLAGDAAHTFNAGGSALNTGIQDAVELARVLIRVLREGASADELDSYEVIRRPAGERTLNQTRVQAALSSEDPMAGSLRAVFGELLAERTSARAVARLLESA
jgi:2-polyprenyl-6-methoxyphenol hydroxylase-like FAD-dependent oxidoreductase